jgi:hypothetical protein
MSNGRRVLYSPSYIQGFRNALCQARADLHAMSFRHACELADLRKEFDQVRADYAELRSTVLARQDAEAELAALYRERAIARARAAERDPALPLN